MMYTSVQFLITSMMMMVIGWILLLLSAFRLQWQPAMSEQCLVTPWLNSSSYEDQIISWNIALMTTWWMDEQGLYILGTRWFIYLCRLKFQYTVLRLSDLFFQASYKVFQQMETLLQYCLSTVTQHSMLHHKWCNTIWGMITWMNPGKKKVSNQAYTKTQLTKQPDSY